MGSPRTWLRPRHIASLALLSLACLGSPKRDAVDAPRHLSVAAPGGAGTHRTPTAPDTEATSNPLFGQSGFAAAQCDSGNLISSPEFFSSPCSAGPGFWNPLERALANTGLADSPYLIAPGNKTLSTGGSQLFAGGAPDFVVSDPAGHLFVVDRSNPRLLAYPASLTTAPALPAPAAFASNPGTRLNIGNSDFVGASRAMIQKPVEPAPHRTEAIDSSRAEPESVVQRIREVIPEMVREIEDAARRFVADAGSISGNLVHQTANDLGQGLRAVERNLARLEPSAPPLPKRMAARPAPPKQELGVETQDEIGALIPNAPERAHERMLEARANWWHSVAPKEADSVPAQEAWVAKRSWLEQAASRPVDHALGALEPPSSRPEPDRVAERGVAPIETAANPSQPGLGADSPTARTIPRVRNDSPGDPGRPYTADTQPLQADVARVATSHERGGERPLWPACDSDAPARAGSGAAGNSQAGGQGAHIAGPSAPTPANDPNRDAPKLAYDPVNHQLIIADSAGRKVQVSYDASNRIVALVDPIGLKTVYAYDNAGKLASVTDPTGTALNLANEADRNPAGEDNEPTAESAPRNSRDSTQHRLAQADSHHSKKRSSSKDHVAKPLAAHAAATHGSLDSSGPALSLAAPSQQDHTECLSARDLLSYGLRTAGDTK